MDDNIAMQTIFGDGSQQNSGLMGALLGAGKRLLTGESLFMTVFQNQGAGKKKVAFGAPYPGKIIPIHLADLGGELITQKDSFLCAAKGVSISIAFQKRLGAGLFGMLFGGGMFGGLGGIASFLGLILQIGLVVIVARLAWVWWQRRQQPAFAGPSLRNAATGGSGLGASLGLGAATSAGAAPAGGDQVGIKPADFDAFERLLGEIQTAYGAEDLGALRAHATPEMLSYFAEDLTQNTSRGVVNQVSDVKLLQGDLSEAWREGDAEYATVAMRFSLVDRTVERASGRLVEGSASPTEVTEIWTFRRAPGGSWLLSAIQQA